MFFATYWNWLRDQLASYVGTNTAVVAQAIEPAAVTSAVIFVMLWGYMSITGRIQDQVMEGFRRIFVILVVIGVGINLWAYNTVIVDTFFNAPAQLAAVITGSADPITVLDEIWNKGGSVASELWNKGGVFGGDFGFYLAGGVVYLVIAVVCVYCLFLFSLALIATSLVLVVGPIFIVLLLFDATKRFFESWIAMLSNYALVTILAVLVCSLLLRIVASYAQQTAALGSAVLTVDALNMLLVSGLTFLVLKQVPSIAAGLASGVALGSFNAVSSLMNWGLGTTKRTAYDVTRGVMDGWRGESFGRFDSLRRGVGNLAGRGLGHVRDGLTAPRTGGVLVPRETVMPPRRYR